MRQDYQLVTVRGLFDSKESYADKTVTVGGWIRNNRDSKSIGFIALAASRICSWCTAATWRISLRSRR